MESFIYSIGKMFSRTPGPRFENEGPNSGHKFRTEYLLPRLRQAIEQNHILKIDLDGTAGFGTSFLEESFGGLIRENDLELEIINKYLQFKSDEEKYLIDDIRDYLKEANEQCIKA